MDAFRHEGKGLLYLTVHPDGYRPEEDYPLVIMLHGFGAHMGDLAGLAPYLDRTGYVYACPNAPLAVQLGPGMAGFAWLPPRGTATPQDTEGAQTLLNSFFDEVMAQYRVPPGRAVLLGFSQGGGMTYRCGLERPDLFAGLVVLSGALPNEQEMQSHFPAQRTQPIFLAHGLQDSMISVERARLARALLEREGYHPRYQEYEMGHEISQELLLDLASWMHEVLPPLR